MMDPVMASALLLGGHRLAACAEQVAARRAGARQQHDLAECAYQLPAGSELGEIRADGSQWWIRISPAAK